MQRHNAMARCAKSRQTPAPLVEGVQRRLRGAGMLVAEDDVVVHEVADRLHARPTQRRIREQFPRDVAQAVGLAVAAAQQEDESLFRQVLHVVLPGVGKRLLRQSGIPERGVRGQRERALGRCMSPTFHGRVSPRYTGVKLCIEMSTALRPIHREESELMRHALSVGTGGERISAVRPGAADTCRT